ncbi:TetR/AcrR family transcriptional regulator [Schaalia vaccimaxillae]|uniref:TetR/AcrR family transcriptional regulator n=1 Tax=Schaalia vaccimaxillae TaxID=183916 RepID=UPI0003B6075E|nr:TetR/AcrR family transcriptional regulator [Schaalia vaccimaxillae]
MAAQKKSRGGYSVGQQTRESILISAMKLIAENGYHGFSLRDLGREVGISHPAVIYHYPSKEDLLRAVVKRAEDRLGIFKVAVQPSEILLGEKVEYEITEEGIANGTLIDYAIQLMRFSLEPEADQVLALDAMLATEASSPIHPAHNHYKYRFQAIEDFITAEVSRMIREGTLELALTPRMTAQTLLRHWYGGVVSSRYAADAIDAKEFVSEFLALCVQMINLSAQFILDVGTSVPDEVLEVYAKVLRKSRETRA